MNQQKFMTGDVSALPQFEPNLLDHQKFMAGYIDAVFQFERDLGGNPLVKGDDRLILGDAARIRIYTETRNFYLAVSDLLTPLGPDAMPKAGFDFLATRNRHDGGFFDRVDFYGSELAHILTRAALACGGVTFSVVDGKVCIE